MFPQKMAQLKFKWRLGNWCHFRSKAVPREDILTLPFVVVAAEILYLQGWAS